MRRFGILVACIFGTSSSLSITTHHRIQNSVEPWGTKLCQMNADDVRQIPDISLADKDNFNDGSSLTVLDRPKSTRRNEISLEGKESFGNDGWEVRIYNDGTNTREFVARCLVKVASLTEFAAYHTMMHAHQNGIAVVGQWEYERAELYNEALKLHGITSDLNRVDE